MADYVNNAADDIKNKTRDMVDGAVANVKDEVKQLEEKYNDAKQYAADNIEEMKANIGDLAKPLQDVREKIVSSTSQMSITDKVKGATAMASSPTIVYLAISITALGMAALENLPTKTFVFRIFSIMLWAFCVNTICNYDMEVLAWFIVLIPYLLIVLQILDVVQVPRILFNVVMSPAEQSFFGV